MKKIIYYALLVLLFSFASLFWFGYKAQGSTAFIPSNPSDVIEKIFKLTEKKRPLIKEAKKEEKPKEICTGKEYHRIYSLGYRAGMKRAKEIIEKNLNE